MGAVQSAYGALGITGGTITGNLTVVGTTAEVVATAGTTAYSAKVTGDTATRFAVGGDGKLNWGDGTDPTDTDLYRVAANILQTDGTFQVLTDQNVGGNINAITAGKGLTVKAGTNARIGTTALTAGSAVVANTSVTAKTVVLLTSQVDGGTPGWLRCSARTAGTSFTITSSSNTDTSTVGWLLVEFT